MSRTALHTPKHDDIVVTEAGVISAIGAGLEEFVTALYAGASAQHADSAFAGAVTAGIHEFNPQRWLGAKGTRTLDRPARFLCVATQLALGRSELQGEDHSDGNLALGLVCGSMFGTLHSITGFDWSGFTDGPAYVNPMEFPNTVLNSAAGQAAIRFGLKGVNSTISAGMVSSLYALDYAVQSLSLGRARVLLVGGCEELSQEALFGFRKSGYLSPTNQARPFAADRDGTVLGEGCSLMALESCDTALARGAKPWVKICGFGSVHSPRNGYHDAVAVESIQMALDASKIGPEDIACVVASANGSPAGDEVEACALQKVFGQRLQTLPVFAPKAALGELMGAAGAVAALAAVQCLLKRSVPPTVGATGPAMGLRLSPLAQPCDGDYALVDGFNCEGNNACLVMRRWTE